MPIDRRERDFDVRDKQVERCTRIHRIACQCIHDDIGPSVVHIVVELPYLPRDHITFLRYIGEANPDLLGSVPEAMEGRP